MCQNSDMSLISHSLRCGYLSYPIRNTNVIDLRGAGAKYLTDEEALMVGKDNMRHSHATHDLYNAIDEGNFPVWNFAVQVC